MTMQELNTVCGNKRVVYPIFGPDRDKPFLVVCVLRAGHPMMHSNWFTQEDGIPMYQWRDYLDDEQCDAISPWGTRCDQQMRHDWVSGQKHVDVDLRTWENKWSESGSYTVTSEDAEPVFLRELEVSIKKYLGIQDDDNLHELYAAHLLKCLKNVNTFAMDLLRGEKG